MGIGSLPHPNWNVAFLNEPPNFPERELGECSTVRGTADPELQKMPPDALVLNVGQTSRGWGQWCIWPREGPIPPPHFVPWPCVHPEAGRMGGENHPPLALLTACWEAKLCVQPATFYWTCQKFCLDILELGRVISHVCQKPIISICSFCLSKPAQFLPLNVGVMAGWAAATLQPWGNTGRT